MITFGTNPGMGIPIGGSGAGPGRCVRSDGAAELKKALKYMDLRPGKPLAGTSDQRGVHR